MKLPFASLATAAAAFTLAAATMVATDDCNANGVPDDEEISGGLVSDDDANGVPDSCESPGCAPLPGGALRLDRSSLDRAEILNFGERTPTREITIEFWQFVLAPAWQTTFNMSPVDEGSRYLFHGPFADGRVYWDFGACNPNFGPCEPAYLGRLDYLPSENICGSWQHFALVASAEGDFMRIYRNGMLEAQKTGMRPHTPGPAALAIGGGPSYHGMLSGFVDEFRIWNFARQPADIVRDMRRAVAPDAPGLAAYFRFDELQAVGAGDLTGHGFDAALLGSARIVPVQRCCPADINRDGRIDPDDAADFIVCAFAEPPCPEADFSGDAAVDPSDLDAFLNAYFGAGC